MKNEETQNKYEELDIEDLKKELEDCKIAKDEYLAGWQRAQADFINYKREEKERVEDFLKYSSYEFIIKVLPILDNFELALNNNFIKNGEEKIIQGFSNIKLQIQDLLKSYGVEEIKTVGEQFDPKFHEVVGEVEPSAAGKPSTAKAVTGKTETIIEEVQKGYVINGQLLRPAKVKITK